MTEHLCLTCRHAAWRRSKGGRLTGVGFCDAPDPKLPDLPAVKWWSVVSGTRTNVRGGDLNRRPEYPVDQCHYYDRAKP